MQETDSARAAASLPLFQGLSAEQLDKVMATATEVSRPADRVLFNEGQRAEGFYAVVEGRVKVYKLSPSGKEQILHVFGPGGVLAEAAVFSGGDYPASAMTLEPSRMLFFGRDAFRSLLAREPDLSMAMLGLLAGRLREFTQKVEALSLREAPQRLAAHILLLRAETGADAFELDLPKGQLAALLGAQPETLSRMLRKMDEAGYIRLDGRKVRVVDPDALDDLARGLSRL
ncbi:Crp/Fnr family transcriptional regulator [Desulfohalovibrio reitneri]|uniref:Crp/Fnr family transcriptional regulator n=1 Tax=Desulfohalovibrio reitneri TaxID=1307759 RepID=UPI0004A6AAAC|nr:Crp/Fnr family transcriptional regulator [Desulfohalovibrio reitneri]